MSDERKRKAIQKLKTRPRDRNFALARLGVLAGTRVASHSVRNFFRDKDSRAEHTRDFYAEQAEFLAEELGQLKGSIMKVGQMLSIYARYFMPPEVVDVLRGLQDDTAPVAWETLRPVAASRLGERRMSELEIDPEALAAASLGQVHRARRRSDGAELCIKIQYPGVGDAIDSDVRTMARLVSMARLVPRGIALQPIMDEVREMLHREVDYDAELEATREFRERLKGDKRFIVPRVFPEYSTDQVLTTSYEPGERIQSRAVQNLSQARRNRLAEGALELFLKEFFHWSMVQTDPHFGNYRVKIGERAEQDRLILLDFGATRWFDADFVRSYKSVVRSAFEHDAEGVIEGAQALGLMQPHYPRSIHEAFARVCFLIVEPFRRPGPEGPPEELLTEKGAYRWGQSDLPNRVTRTIARAALSRYFRIPPREIVFLHRRMGGVFMLLAALEAELETHDLLDEYLKVEPIRRAAPD